jgi:hypothetical protein
MGLKDSYHGLPLDKSTIFLCQIPVFIGEIAYFFPGEIHFFGKSKPNKTGDPGGPSPGARPWAGTSPGSHCPSTSGEQWENPCAIIYDVYIYMSVYLSIYLSS